MTPRDFVYWLQGQFELNPQQETLSAEQIKVVKAHIDLVLTNVTAINAVDVQIPDYSSLAGQARLC